MLAGTPPPAVGPVFDGVGGSLGDVLYEMHVQARDALLVAEEGSAGGAYVEAGVRVVRLRARGGGGCSCETPPAGTPPPVEDAPGPDDGSRSPLAEALADLLA
ncbi:hypothetical protein E4U41_007137 [Claviceps citrina]|nr:hypothetical protein E4U41_007137 [Claviceps citrina]